MFITIFDLKSNFRLWHQLTLKLMEFVKNDYFVSNGGLLDVSKV